MRNTNLPSRLLFLCSFLLFITVRLSAQVTTSTVGGTVTDQQGKPLAGATVEISFSDAGIKRHLVTGSGGDFLMPNLRVGGPYTITVSYTGFNPKTESNIFLELGQTNTVDFKLELSSANLSAVTVTGRSRVFNENRTGASVNITSQQIQRLPTISRSADDYTRLTPSASPTYNGVSFAGRNGQYNNYSLDGAVFNNPFGLDAPTPGGQANAQPISLDAIDQIQVNIAPYDVTQAGFTGAGINTVTKSGTNKTFGTIYGFFRNQALTGHKVEGNSFNVPSLHDFQGGASLGGALRKNKLFYFVNFETQQRSDANSAYVADDGTNEGKITTSRVLKTDLEAVSALLKNNYGYVTGPYQDYTQNTTSYKWIAKLDWVINDWNTLTFTYNGLSAYQDKPAHPSAINRRGPDAITLQYQNSGYRMNNHLENFGLELKTNFNSTVSNNLRVINTIFHDFRNPNSTPFPVINITKNNVPYIIAGEEPFSIHNILNQNALQLTDNVTVALSGHTLTFGGSFESFRFENSFNLTGYGFDVFGQIDLASFMAGGYPAAGDVTYAQNAAKADKWTWSYFTVGQAALYAQDAWKISPTFKLTYGLRVDKPVYFYGSKSYFESPIMNPNGTFSGSYSYGMPTVANTDNLTIFDPLSGAPVKNGEAIDNSKFPKATPLFSPRVGFNWNVDGENRIQVRGGSGLFTGRFPFVWLGNQIENPFTGYFNVTARNFHFPQIWRTSAGVDYKLGGTTVLTLDLGYTKDVHAMMVQDYGLGKPTGTLNSGTGDHRAVYLATDKGNTSTYVFGNNGKGYSYNATVQVTENLPMGLYLTGSYNYQVAKDANSISAEISGDAFDRNPIVSNPNIPVVAHSLYGNTHRFVVAGIKRWDYKWGATSVSLFGNWTSGNRFSYTYAGDLTNSSGAGINALLYVPTAAEIGSMIFTPYTDVKGVVQSPAVQRQALEAFIQQDNYLSKHRGQYTERNGGQTPWWSQVDMRVLQDFKLDEKGGQRIQLSMDVVNLGNLISSNWGVRKYASTSGYFQPISYVGTNGSGQAMYQFDPAQTKTFTSSPDLPSRWQIQFGVRYIF
ncbi:MAG TPA: carboxypeptidase regulatory-like domain-containing protein [Puia sp.]|uniref:TonB-dependent receptor n=1 Tax=Puia sp. TaxID=2045100 RepID=UPI002B7C72FE|nr:carboxypeptidase regulatory-like domain-containing protein [Puia sp.]HVU98391.1 carboxypeptidase regulatory-like domain-containing protein [Puia sp.]